MPFPPGDMVAAFGVYMHFQSLEWALVERHPELTGRVRLDSDKARPYLAVELPGGRKAVLAQVKLDHTFAWAVIGPALGGEPSIWPINSTPDEVLVDALHAHATAHLTGTPVPSPWCWDESESSDMTELADLLVERGVNVRRVVAGNRYFAYGPAHEPKLHIVSKSEGAYVEVELLDAFVRISLRQSIGWLVDRHVPEQGAWRRVELGRTLWGRTLPTPGVPHAKAPVSRIAELIADGPKAWVEGPALWWPPKRRTAPDSSPSVHDPVRAALEQLTALGFGDVREGGLEDPIRSGAYHVVRHARAKKLSMSEMQRLNGLAAAAGDDTPKRLIVITDSGISRPAADFADAAKAFVYHLDPATGRLSPLNSRADDVMPPYTDPGEHRLEPWFQADTGVTDTA